jgi:hypothetical protein
LIAHSAGANVIQTAVDRIADYYKAHPSEKKPIIQLTFLDAYVPYFWEQDRFGDLHGLPGYAEQYVDIRLVSPTTFTDGTHTWFSKATNFDITKLDTKGV